MAKHQRAGGRGAARPAAGGGSVPAAYGRVARADALGWLDLLIFGAVLVMVAIGPYFRGLFFPKEQMVALLVALALFAARWFVKFQRGDYGFLRGPLDWAVLALFLAYVASTFVAANRRLAIQEDIKYLLYFIVYWLVRELARDGAAAGVGEPWWMSGEGRRAMVLGAVAAAGVWLSILGIGAAAGTFSYNGAFDGQRIYSALQYPNTLAAYLTAAFFCALSLWARAGAAVWRRPGEAAGESVTGAAVVLGVPPRPAAAASLWAAGLYAMLFTFIFTYSRGGWLVFPLMALVYLVVAPRGYRLAALAMMLATVAAVAPFAVPFAGAVAAKNAAGVWRAFLGGVPVALVLNAAVLALLRFLSGLSAAARAGVLAGAGALGGAAAALVLGRLAVPAAVLERARSISLGDYDARSRLEWARDALKIVKDHPVLGAGGGGWEAVYHKYQSYGYWSTQVHNHFAQVWVETGTIGFLIFLAWWGLLKWQGWRAWRAARAAGEDGLPGQALLAGALVGALALGAHSALDFNLSLSAVTLAMMGLFAVVRAAPAAGPDGGAAPAAASGGRKGAAEYRFLPRLAAYGLTAGAFVFVAVLLDGHAQGQAAAVAMNDGRVAEARALFQKAIARDPFTASFHVDIGQTLLFQAQAEQNTRLFRDAGRYLEQGVALDPYNPNYHAMFGQYLLQTGAIEEGLGHVKQALDLQPWEAQRYEQLAGALVAVARYDRQQGRDDEARRLMARAMDLREQLRQRAAMVPGWVVAQYRTPPSTPGLTLYAGEAAAMLGDLAAAERDLRAAAGGDASQVKGEAALWLSQVLKAQGRGAEADQALAQARAAMPGADQAVQQIASFIRTAPVSGGGH